MLVGMMLIREISLHLRSSVRVCTCLTVSISHPRTTFCVLQAVPPLQSFLINIVSSRAVSSLVFGRKSSLMAQKRCRIICHLYSNPPCTIPMKSSRYTSTCARAVARACRYRSFHLLSVPSVEASSSDEVYGGIVSDRLYRGCGGAVLRWGRVLSLRSLTVSVVAQKKAEYSTYLLDIDK